MAETKKPDEVKKSGGKKEEEHLDVAVDLESAAAWRFKRIKCANLVNAAAHFQNATLTIHRKISKSKAETSNDEIYFTPPSDWWVVDRSRSVLPPDAEKKEYKDENIGQEEREAKQAEDRARRKDRRRLLLREFQIRARIAHEEARRRAERLQLEMKELELRIRIFQDEVVQRARRRQVRRRAQELRAMKTIKN